MGSPEVGLYGCETVTTAFAELGHGLYVHVHDPEDLSPTSLLPSACHLLMDAYIVVAVSSCSGPLDASQVFVRVQVSSMRDDMSSAGFMSLALAEEVDSQVSSCSDLRVRLENLKMDLDDSTHDHDDPHVVADSDVVYTYRVPLRLLLGVFALPAHLFVWYVYAPSQATITSVTLRSAILRVKQVPWFSSEEGMLHCPCMVPMGIQCVADEFGVARVQLPYGVQTVGMICVDTACVLQIAVDAQPDVRVVVKHGSTHSIGFVTQDAEDAGADGHVHLTWEDLFTHRYKFRTGQTTWVIHTCSPNEPVVATLLCRNTMQVWNGYSADPVFIFDIPIPRYPVVSGPGPCKFLQPGSGSELDLDLCAVTELRSGSMKHDMDSVHHSIPSYTLQPDN